MNHFRLLIAAIVTSLVVVAGAVAADPDPAATTTTPTTTEIATPAPPADGMFAAGVIVGGLDIGGQTPAQARAALTARYRADVELQLGGRTWRVTAKRIGLHVYLARPLQQAYAVGRTRAPGDDISVVTRLAGGGLRSYVAYLARTFNVKPVDARFALRKSRAVIVPDRWGRAVARSQAAAAIAATAHDPNRAGATVVPVRILRPLVVRRTLGSAVVIDRSLHRLTLFGSRGQVVRVLGVAVGQSIYPTPTGSFKIVDKQLHPWWYPPNSSWAEGAKPIPPGPSNPLGTRWMGLDSPGVGIHGTPNPASIGYSASHGCIRMRIPDAEWVFQRVRVGTPVWIVH